MGFTEIFMLMTDKIQFNIDLLIQPQETLSSSPDCARKMLEICHWNAKRLLKNCQKSKTLLPKFQKLRPKFLDIFITTVIKSFIFRSSQ